MQKRKTESRNLSPENNRPDLSGDRYWDKQLAQSADKLNSVLT
ncbi:MAG: hypothetical protein WAU01_14745 [Saprospiraceae bacterium]